MLWTESSDKTGVTLTCGVVGLPFAVSQSKRRSGPIVPAFSSWLGRGLGVPPAASLRTPQRQPAIAAGGKPVTDERVFPPGVVQHSQNGRVATPVAAGSKSSSRCRAAATTHARRRRSPSRSDSCAGACRTRRRIEIAVSNGAEFEKSS